MRKSVVFLMFLFGFIYNSHAVKAIKTCTVTEGSKNYTHFKSIEIFNEHSINPTARVTVSSGEQATAKVISSFWGYSISISPSECEKLPKIRFGWSSELCRTFSVVKEKAFGKKYGIVLYENGLEGRFHFQYNDFTCLAE